MNRKRKFWLFKSEPSSFSFDDLKNSPSGTTHWDGVRNYQARNYLRDEVKPGDGVLFYHSNIPQPRIAGIAMVVKGGYPDWTALYPDSDHFDPRCTAHNSIWFMVDVRYVVSLAREVTLEEMKEQPSLDKMQLLHRSRLSIQPVTREEWQTILQMGGIDVNNVELLLDSCEEG